MSKAPIQTRSGPPRRGPRVIKYAEEAKFMREHPGTWTLVREAPNEPAAWASAQAIKAGRLAAFRPSEEFEAYTTGVEVIARYVGNPNNPGE